MEIPVTLFIHLSFLFLFQPANGMGRAIVNRLLAIALAATGRIFDIRFTVIAQLKNLAASGDTQPAAKAEIGVNAGNFAGRGLIGFVSHFTSEIIFNL